MMVKEYCIERHGNSGLYSIVPPENYEHMEIPTWLGYTRLTEMLLPEEVAKDLAAVLNFGRAIRNSDQK